MAYLLIKLGFSCKEPVVYEEVSRTVCNNEKELEEGIEKAIGGYPAMPDGYQEKLSKLLSKGKAFTLENYNLCVVPISM